ncbi:hypothetical protein F0562_017810 [Nyssa sinensis]|uniref:Uncharacterized protein n=1 Tax=Nyssa sinensis TaxID=561372 RepID=A0A5J4ZG98_9ASTE|nr:hypothetical protein F0562_017810 [Nyssa sinensis]
MPPGLSSTEWRWLLGFPEAAKQWVSRRSEGANPTVASVFKRARLIINAGKDFICRMRADWRSFRCRACCKNWGLTWMDRDRVKGALEQQRVGVGFVRIE